MPNRSNRSLPPLTPPEGGCSITPSSLQPGDIIASTTTSWKSWLIRKTTGSDISHNMLYLGNGEVIEAVGTGVVRRSLAAALGDASLAVVYRHPNLLLHQKEEIVERAVTMVDRPYGTLSGLLGPAFRDKKALGRTCDSGADARLYCSELCARAYEQAGAPLRKESAETTNPHELIASPSLKYTGHLVTAESQGRDLSVRIEPPSKTYGGSSSTMPLGLNEPTRRQQSVISNLLKPSNLDLSSAPTTMRRRIQAGDSLSSLAQQHGYDNPREFERDFKRLNPAHKDPNLLIKDRTYQMPFKGAGGLEPMIGRSHKPSNLDLSSAPTTMRRRIQAGDSLSSLAQQHGYDNPREFERDFKRLNPAHRDPNLLIKDRTYQMPFKGGMVPGTMFSDIKTRKTYVVDNNWRPRPVQPPQTSRMGHGPMTTSQLLGMVR